MVGSSGDGGVYPTPRGWGGQVKEVSLPTSDPLVLGVGGTILTVNPKTGAYISETVWPNSGGGFSRLYARPAYQDGVAGISKTRGVPDVAGDAAQAGGWRSFSREWQRASLRSPPGTSDSAPLWGGLVALADQYAHRDLGFINPAIYSIARSSSYHRAFHDITTDKRKRLPGDPRLGPGNGLGNP